MNEPMSGVRPEALPVPTSSGAEPAREPERRTGPGAEPHGTRAAYAAGNAREVREAEDAQARNAGDAGGARQAGEAGEPVAAEDAGALPLGVPRTPTGHAEVDVLLERLADADRLGTGGHLEVYEDVHRELRDTLASLDGRPAPAPHPTATPDGRPAGRGSPPLTPTPYDDDRS